MDGELIIKTNWHALSINDALTKLNSDKKGLTEKEAINRQSLYGFNEITDEKKLLPLKIFLSQFKNIMVLMLVVATIISFLINELTDAITILVILVLNSVLGFVQEYKAGKAMDALKSLAAPKAVVIRDGVEQVVWSRELVPGDIVKLTVGDISPANIRLIESINLKVDQAHLTGESISIMKTIDKVVESASMADRTNIVLMGSVVNYGSAIGLVTKTGMMTEIGKIAESVAAEEKEITPLQRETDLLGKWLAIFAITAVCVVFSVGVILKHDFVEMLLTSVSLAVSAVPEGLPAVITITLAIGMQRMASKNAVVRKLSAVQTLGSITTICSDKTGTLTKNEMTVTRIFDGVNDYNVTGAGYNIKGEFMLNNKKIDPKKNKSLITLLTSGSLCNNAYYGKKNSDYYVVGDPTEGSLLACAAKAGLWHDNLKKEGEIINEVSFSSERKRMSVVFKSKGKLFVYSKGAPDVMLDLCDRVMINGSIKKLTKDIRERILDKNGEMAGSALRVLAIAYKEVNAKSISEKEVEQGLVLLGLTGMIDPPRPEIKEAINLTKKAGIRVIIVTGDHKLTAIAVARSIGLFDSKSVAVSGEEIDKMSPKEFKEAVSKVTIFARVSPEHKLRIVEMLKEQGEIVAVTGDGVNDAPALKSAHIGVAMGIKGTDVSKEASEMVLTDDNFSTIVTAIEGGRAIFANIKKFIKFLLSANADTISEVMFSLLLGLPLPFLPIHILWMNLVTDGLPALALSVDAKSNDIMSQKPRNPKKSLVREIAIFVVVAGIIDAIASISLFIIALNYEGYFINPTDLALSKARTMAISSAIIYELFFVFNCRDDNRSVWGKSFKENFLSNKFLTTAVIVSLALQMMLVYFPPFQMIFRTVALSPFELFLTFAFASFGLFILPRWFHKDLTIGLKNNVFNE
ncbi:MAG: cation-translocating P-type ATPase [Candidatus Nanoarchaeia archaeon]|jgi:Ca2+-transporting ATPase